MTPPPAMVAVDSTQASAAPQIRSSARTHDDRAQEAFIPICTSPRLGRLPAFWKRTTDIVVSSLLLVVLAPLLLLALLAVRIDSPGPMIFAQNRVGRHGRQFRIYKLRTMVHNPTDTLVWLTDADGTRAHKVHNDARVTRAGRWLRKTSIDELPQLINVLRGEMSLVGPRPELPDIVATYAPWQHERHVVRPGLTGWWQVSGRGDLPMHQNTDLDLYYIRHQSLTLDARILVRTVGVVCRGLGAF